MTISTETIRSLERSWATPSGFLGYLTAVNHRAVGVRYMDTGLVFFALAGIAALLMRLQLAVPENTFLSAEAYNQLFTMHGSTMMFLFAVPILEGAAIYFTPLQIGARDMVFPRLNAFGYGVFLLGGATMWIALLFGVAPDGGWFNYVPLTGAQFSPGLNIDFWVLPVSLLEVAALVAAVDLIVTILVMRAPGMSLDRVPLFVWAILVTAFMILFAMPALIVASLLLETDRAIGAHFYNPGQGGDPILWQHLFWFFGHPEVYIILLPGLGIVATIVPTFARRPLVGYRPLVVSFVAIGVLSFALWVHHMFTTGMGVLSMSLFSVVSMVIAIPSGVQIFASLATLWHGRIWPKTPLLYVLGFIFIFVMGGITGVMVASIPFDWQVHDTYFLVAHFHYVLVGGLLFPLLAGLFYWFPKVTGRMLSERLGVASFLLIFSGFNIAFFTMHITGFFGMPRRVYTYLSGLGWDGLNLISTIGAFIIAVGVLLVAVAVFQALARRDAAPNDPWRAGTLEWATTSPPQPYNFPATPVVEHRYPLWYERAAGPEVQERLAAESDRLGVLSDRREALGTSTRDAAPQQRVVLPGPTALPLVLALAVSATFIGAIFELALVPAGLAVTAALLVAWNIPSRQGWDPAYVRAGPQGAPPTSMTASRHGIRSPVWWGMALLILIGVATFAVLVSSYLYLRSAHDRWPLGEIAPPDLALPLLGSLLLWASAAPMYAAQRGAWTGTPLRMLGGLAAAAALALAFVALKALELATLDYTWATNAYGSLVWVYNGLFLATALSAVVMALVAGYYGLRGYFHRDRHDGVTATAMWWYFVVGAWVPMFATLYLVPHVWGA